MAQPYNKNTKIYFLEISKKYDLKVGFSLIIGLSNWIGKDSFRYDSF